ncbi:hypothetical protein [Endozoicomonas sp.]|uniref:hypothetical protein n=1 Tax=Endozoicomonas sp. TaxID=1892382 RepID=UPI003D9AD81A
MPKVWNHLKFQYRRVDQRPEFSLPPETEPRFDLDLPLIFKSAHITKSLNKPHASWANYSLELISCVYGISDSRYSNFEVELTPQNDLAIFHLQPTLVWSPYSRAHLNTIRTEYSCMENPEYCQFTLSKISSEFFTPREAINSRLTLAFGENTVMEQTIVGQFEIAPIRDDVINKTISDDIGHMVMTGLPHCQRAPRNKIDQCTLDELQSNLVQKKVSALLIKFSLLGSSSTARINHCYDYKVRCELVTSDIEE